VLTVVEVIGSSGGLQFLNWLNRSGSVVGREGDRAQVPAYHKIAESAVAYDPIPSDITSWGYIYKIILLSKEPPSTDFYQLFTNIRPIPDIMSEMMIIKHSLVGI
jgi:hypothetical protein